MMEGEADAAPLGYTVFAAAEKQMADFLVVFESQHMKWLEEILEAAKTNFGRDEIKLLPKTPCVKNRARKGRRRARKSSVQDTEDPVQPAKRTRTSTRQAAKRQSSQAQEISDFHKEALKSASVTSPPTATPPAKKSRGASLQGETIEATSPCATGAPSIPIKEEEVTAEKVAETAATAAEPTPPPQARRSRAARASTRASTRATTAKTIGRQTGRGRRTKKSSTEEEGTCKEELKTGGKEEDVAPVTATAEKKAPPEVKKKPVRASTRASVRQTATRQSSRTRLTRNVGQSSADSSSEASAAEDSSSVRSDKKPVSRLGKRFAGKAKTPSTPGESRYKDHVKRLVQLHEGVIAKVQTAEDASSPKRPRLGQAPSSPRTPGTPKTPRSPKTPTSTAGQSPYRSSPLLSIQVSSKARLTPGKASTPPAKAKGKAVLEEKAKEVSSFFSGLRSRGAQPTVDVSKTTQDQETHSEAPADEAVIKPQEVLPDTSVQPPPAADSTVLSQDSLEEIHDDDEPDSASSSAPPQVASTSASSSSSSLSSLGMEEDSLMEEKSIRQQRRSTRASRRLSVATRLSTASSQSKRRTSTYLRLHQGRQSIRRSTRQSLARAVSHMERDSLEPEKQGSPSERRSERIAKKLSLHESEEDEGQAANPKDDKRGSSSSSSSSRSSSGSDDIIEKTPSPECPPSKVIRPHPKSFLNALNAGKKKKLVGATPGTPRSSSVITSFIQRNTPQKKTLKELQAEKKAQLLEKQKKEEVVRRKMAEERKKNMEELKKSREEKQRRAAIVREQFHRQQQERKLKMQERDEIKQTLNDRQKEDRKKEDLQKRRLYEKKKAEAEERRKQETDAKLKKLKEQDEEKKRHQQMLERRREYEEQERIRRAEEAKHQAETQRLKQERLRLEEFVKKRERQMALEKEQQRLKEERDREKKEQERRRQLEAEQREKERRLREEAERQRRLALERSLRDKQRQEEEAHLKAVMEKEKALHEHERLKASILKQNTSLNQHNTSAHNSTFNKDKVESSPQSYELTPQRIYVAASAENYGIDDLHSDDSSDDEEAPRKKIPGWAQGGALKTALINQHYHPPDFAAMFPVIEPPNLDILFAKKRPRFYKRTSSAVWNSPIMNHLK